MELGRKGWKWHSKLIMGSVRNYPWYRYEASCIHREITKEQTERSAVLKSVLLALCKGRLVLQRPPGLLSPGIGYSPSLTFENVCRAFLLRAFPNHGRPEAVGFFYSVSDIPHVCKRQAFNGPSVCCLLMVYFVAGKTVSPVMFLAPFHLIH